jgi:hypothetical protein
MPKKFNFFDVFQRNPDGSMTPLRVINVNGITFGPGVVFGPGVNFGGVDFFKYQNHDIAAEEENGILVIKGFYERAFA